MQLQNEHILLVESDPQISETIAQQILRPLGYHVDVFESASSVIFDVPNISPDVIITDLYLPGISGKDLLIALTSQGIDIPFIVITPKGHESDALQAFRLGAVNFLSYPIRETEVIEVVEDTLHQIRKKRQLNEITQRLDQINEEIEQRLHAYTEILSIGKLPLSSTNLQSLYERLITVAINITQAESAWLSLFDQESGKFILRACLNCDAHMQSMRNLPFENNLSSQVASSSQTISVHGEAINQYKLANVNAILVVPIKHEQKVIGMIAVERKTTQPFTNEQKNILEVTAEFTPVFLEIFSRFQNLELQPSQMQKDGKSSSIDTDIKNDLLFQSGKELRNTSNRLLENLDFLSNQGNRRLTPRQNQALTALQEETGLLLEITDSMVSITQGDIPPKLEKVDLNELIRSVKTRSQIIAHGSQIKLKSELPSQPVIVTVFSSQISRVIEGLLSNAIKHSPPKGKITIRVEKKGTNAIVIVNDQGEGIDQKLADSILEKKSSLFTAGGLRFGGIGISLPIIKKIITAHQGEFRIKSGIGKGFSVTFSLPLLKTG